MKIGVLALQGDFAEHCLALRREGAEAVEVRLPAELEGLHGLIIPGGESTSIGKLAVSYGLIDAIRDHAKRIPVWGTCGGLVLMARNVGLDQPLLSLLDITVKRNAFGRQVDSFEESLQIAGLEGGPFHGIFIRAPVVSAVGPKIEILCSLKDGRIVAVREGRHMAASFHPELTCDGRMHRLFMEGLS